MNLLIHHSFGLLSFTVDQVSLSKAKLTFLLQSHFLSPSQGFYKCSLPNRSFASAFLLLHHLMVLGYPKTNTPDWVIRLYKFIPSQLLRPEVQDQGASRAAPLRGPSPRLADVHLNKQTQTPPQPLSTLT